MAPVVLPRLRDWQVFEEFCRDLFERHWQAQTAFLVGRQGQSQNGIDVIVLMPDLEMRAVQCKLKSEGKQLERDEMWKELDATKKNIQPPKHYVFATTAPADREVQEWALELGREFGFAVEVCAWDRLSELVRQHPDLLERYFDELVIERNAADIEADDAVGCFLRDQWADLIPLPNGAFRGADRRLEIRLTDVYTALSIRGTVKIDVKVDNASGNAELAKWALAGSPLAESYERSLRKQLVSYLGSEAGQRFRNTRKWRWESQGELRSFERSLTCLEAVAGNRRLVLVGEAGSGKSTFAKHLALIFLGEHRGEPSINLGRVNSASDIPGFVPWPWGAPVAFFVELWAFVASPDFPPPGSRGQARHLEAFLASMGRSAEDGSPLPSFGRWVRRLLDGDGEAIVLLDGLDETPAASDVRERIRECISSFVEIHPRCRVLVTSRPYAYAADSPWRLDEAGFENATLAPFDEEQQQAFIELWYQRLVRRGQLKIDKARRAALVADLASRIRSTAYLRPLAERPLMLTMMVHLHATRGGSLPGGRAGLYAGSADLLLDSWNESRRGEKASDLLKMPISMIREAIELLAFQTHRSGGHGEGWGAEIADSELWKALSEVRKKHRHAEPVDASAVLAYLHERSGILIGESESVYRFPHRSYQEYLAACHLLRTNFPKQLAEVLEEGLEPWREVVQLLVGQPIGGQEPPSTHVAWTALGSLVPQGPPDAGPEPGDSRFRRALYAGLAIRECELWENVEEWDEDKLENIRLWLSRTVEMGALDLEDRVQAAQLLCLLGDDRPGVGLRPDGLPDIEWVEFPDGSFLMGDYDPDCGGRRHEGRLSAFAMARYPVTNAQFGAFVEDGGYADRNLWSEEGWAWKEKADADGIRPPGYWGEAGLDPALLLPNHPRIDVSWHEAMAFCRWLSRELGPEVFLPTEAQWERSARGTDGRVYPWGDEFDVTRCNSEETGLSSTSAVGLFPCGESSPGSEGVGILDASGNVWEWCVDGEGKEGLEPYPEGARTDPVGPARGTLRVVRGGSWSSYARSVRAASRNAHGPDDRFSNLGFRLARGPRRAEP